MSDTVGTTLDYKLKAKSKSHYRMTRILQQTGGEDVKMTGNGTTSVFEIPPVVHNLARSHLEFDITYAGVNARVVHVYRDVLPIQRVELLNRSGVYLMDIVNFQQFINATSRLETDIDTYRGAQSTGDFLYPANSLSNLTPVLSSVGPTGDGAGAGNLTISYRVDLGKIRNTILSLDKSIFVGEHLNLRITWSNSADMGWTSAPGGGDPLVTYAGNMSVSKLRLHLAQEGDEAVAREIMDKASQIPILIPYTWSYKTNRQGKSQALSLRFGAGHGRTLERVYNAFYGTAEEKNTRYLRPLTHVDSFYTLLNNRRMQEFDYSSADHDVYNLKRDYAKGYVAGLTRAIYEDQFCFVEDWCNGHHNCAVNNEISGLSLTGDEIKWDLFCQSSNIAPATSGGRNLNHYTFAVCQRLMTVSSAGVQIA